MSTANTVSRFVSPIALESASETPVPLSPARGFGANLIRFVARASRFAERPPAIRFTVAIVAVLLALGVRLLLDPWLADRGAYYTFLLAVILVSVCSGLGPALVSAVLGALLASYFFVEPRNSLANLEIESALPVLMGLSVAIVASIVSEALRREAVDNERLYRLAHDSDIRKDEFLAMASHELRAPLSPIRNALYVLRRTNATEGDLGTVRELMQRQVEHLVRLVDDLVDVSRITRGRIVLREDSTTLRRLVDTAVEIARPLIDERGHTLTVHLPEDLVWVRVDSVRMVQVISNLLNNAAKYTGWRGQIWLTAERTVKGEILLRVRDNGMGISAELLPRVFDLFEQGNRSMARTEGGLGVGLTLVRNLVELHGGSVQAASAGPSQGAEFTVRLPTRRVLGDAEPVRAATDDAPPAQAAKHSVLIVDDNRPTANSMATILRLWGHEVIVAYDAFSALEAARAAKPEVVLADVGLPRMDGYDLARQLRQTPGMEDVTLVATTGHGLESDVQRATTAGFDHHLLKPLDPVVLERLLARL